MATTILFSYGSLQLPAVQLATFGRLLSGRPDRLPGVTTGAAGDVVTGTAYEITWAELAAADGYEAPEYARVWAELGSGRGAWVYVDLPARTASLGGEPGPDLPEFDDPPGDPLLLMRHWLAVAVRRRVSEPGAFVLATADADGQPSGRVVLLKDVDDRGLVFSSDGGSRKGHELAGNPRAAAVFHWRETVQQIVVAGSVRATPAEESAALFAARPVGARVVAAVSAQSRPLDDEAALRRRVAEATPRARPAGWTGYVLEPHRIEFWQGSADRLHRRLEYRRYATGWTHRRLQP